MTNGAFKMASWTHDAEIVMVPNENYYDASSITLEKLTFKLMDDANAQLTAFKNGDLDYMQNPPPDEMATLLTDGTVIPGDYLGSYYACFNNTKEPFNDPLVRKAFSLAIDRNYIVEQVTQAGEIAADAWVPVSVVDAEGTSGDDFRTVGGSYWSVSKDDYEANCEEARDVYKRQSTPCAMVSSPSSPTWAPSPPSPWWAASWWRPSTPFPAWAAIWCSPCRTATTSSSWAPPSSLSLIHI